MIARLEYIYGSKYSLFVYSFTNANFAPFGVKWIKRVKSAEILLKQCFMLEKYKWHQNNTRTVIL